MASNKVLKPAPLELVFSAGGAKGYGHVGVIKAIEKYRVAIGDVTGVSIGSLIAAFYCNGFSADEINDILAREAFLQEGAHTLKRWQDALTLQAVQSAGLVNLAPIMQKVVRKYELRPQENLKIIAYNVNTFSPVVFSGTGYNLAKAMAGSCSVPFIMLPVFEKLRGSREESKLVDGGLYHTHPTSFCKGPAIVSRLGFASRLPGEWLPPAQMLLHFAEMANCLILDWLFGDPASHHIVVESGMPEVATMSFSSSARKCREMVAYGFSQAERQFKLAKSARRLPRIS